MRLRRGCKWVRSRHAQRSRLPLRCALCLAVSGAGPVQAQPAPAAAIDAFATLRSWLDEDAAPRAPTALDPPNAWGARVTLRLHGRALGSGQTLLAAPSTSDAPTEALWRAFTEALGEALQRTPADALGGQGRGDFLAALSLDVELAHRPAPLTVQTWEEAAQALSPGLDGLALARRDGAVVAAVFPGAMLATNLPVQGAFRALSAAAGAPLAPLEQLRDEHSLTLLTFRTTHLAQRKPEDPPTFLHRSGRVVALEEVSPENLPALARRLALNLLQRGELQTRPSGLRTLRFHDVYEPWRGAFDPPSFADAATQALGAYALARAAQVETGRRRDILANSALEALRALAPPQRLPGDAALAPEAAALAALALDALQRTGVALGDLDPTAVLKPLAHDALADRLAALDPGDAPRLALIACAWATASAQDAGRWRSESPPPASREQARDLTQRLFGAMAARGDLTPAMPWLGLAALQLAQEQTTLAQAPALREHIALVEQHQLSPLDTGFADRDLVGGVVFTKNGARLPTWRTCQAAIFPARALGDQRLTEAEEVPARLLFLLRALRFTKQLAAEEAELHMFVDKPQAKMGVRLALWDQRMPLDAQATALLFVVETIDSLNRQALGAEKAP